MAIASAPVQNGIFCEVKLRLGKQLETTRLLVIQWNHYCGQLIIDHYLIDTVFSSAWSDNLPVEYEGKRFEYFVHNTLI